MWSYFVEWRLLLGTFKIDNVYARNLDTVRLCSYSESLFPDSVILIDDIYEINPPPQKKTEYCVSLLLLLSLEILEK